MSDGYTELELEVVGFERAGDWFKVHTLWHGHLDEPAKSTYEYWCDGRLLVMISEDSPEADAYSKVEHSHRKGDKTEARKAREASEREYFARQKEIRAMKNAPGKTGTNILGKTLKLVWKLMGGR